MGTQPLPKKGAEPPAQFLAHVYCGQTAAWIKMPLVTEVGVGLRQIVLDGDPGPPPLKWHNPQFSANVCCGQTARWMKTPLGMEVDLGPGHIVLDAVPAVRERGSAALLFSPVSTVATVTQLSYC